MAKDFTVFCVVTLWILSVAPPPAVFAGGKITIGGAQSLAPFAEKFSAVFRKDFPVHEIEIRRANSNYAVRAVRSAEVQVGLVTRTLSSAERSEFHVESVGHDAILVLSYPGNPVAALTLEQMRNIYLGQITDWRQVGGEEKGMVPLTREAESGLHKMFIETLFGKHFRGREKAFVLRATKEKVLRTIKRIRGSLGYGIVRPEEAEAAKVTVIAVDGKRPTPANIETEIYPFTRPQLLIARRDADRVTREWMAGFAKFVSQAGSLESR